jgi:uncharacterized protein (TIGR03663 family)
MASEEAIEMNGQEGVGTDQEPMPELQALDDLGLPEVDPDRQPDSPVALLSVERAAWLGVALLAAGLRIVQLGLRPLDQAEAVQALAAYDFGRGIAPAPAGTIPALFTGNTIGFALFGASDITARWLPLLAGLIMVLLPYWLRHRLGRGGALAASLLLALSPTAIFYSRALDGAVLVAASGLAVVVGLINFVDRRQPGALYAAAIAAGVGLCSGTGLWSLLFVLVAFGLVLYLVDRLMGWQSGWSSIVAAALAARGQKGLLAKAGIVLAAVFGLVATTLVLHPAGVGQAADLLGMWAQGFLPREGGQPFIYPVLLLLRYEPLILLLGAIEMVRAAVRRPIDPWWVSQPGSPFPHTVFLMFWAGAALIIVLLGGHRTAGNTLWVLVPLALLGGQGVERAWRWISTSRVWLGAAAATGVALTILAFLYLQVAAYAQSNPAATVMLAGVTVNTTSTYLMLAVVALTLLIGLAAAVWIWRGPAIVLAGVWLTAVFALGFLGFQAAWRVNVARAADSRELMLEQTTVPGIRALVEELETLSLNVEGDAHTLALTVEEATGPVVAWYLREFEQDVVASLSGVPETLAVITLAGDEPAIGETFRGTAFPLRTRWLLWGRWGQDLVRWFLFSEGPLPVVDQEVVLWVSGQR